MKIENVLLDRYGLELKERRSSTNIYDVYAGYISTYPIIVNYLGYNIGCYVKISANKEMLEEHAESLIEEVSMLPHVSEIEIVDSHLSLKVGKVRFSNKKLALALENTIERIVSYFKNNSLLPGDFLKGDYDDSLALYRTGQSYLYLTEESKEIIEEKLEVKDDIKEDKKASVPLGIIGALLGSFIGSLIFTAISFYTSYYLHFSVIIILFAYMGYKLLGKKIGLIGNMINLILSIVFVYPALFIKFAWENYQVYQAESLNFIEIKDFLLFSLRSTQQSELKMTIYGDKVTIATKNMVLYGLIILVLFILPLYSEKKRAGEIVRVEK